MSKHIFLVCLLTIGLTSGTVNGQDTAFTGASGDWNNAANWTTTSVPGAGNGNVFIGHDTGAATADVTIMGAPLNDTIGELKLANGAVGGLNGTLNHSTGSLTANGWSFLATDAAAGTTNVAVYNLSGDASFTSTDQFHLGAGGGADGGLNDGSISIADNAILTAGQLYVGSNDNNVGSVNQTGGTVNVNTWIAIGRENGAVGTYDISGGVLNSNNDWVSVGESSGASGVFNASGNAIINATANGFIVGRNDTADGTLEITGSNVTFNANNFYIGANDSGNDTTATGRLSYVAAASGISAVNVTGNAILGDEATLEVDLTALSAFAQIGLDADGDGFDDTSGLAVSLSELVLIDNSNGVTSGLFLDGAAATLNEGDLVSIGGGKFGVLSYIGGADSLDVTVSIFTAVPEPSSLAIVSVCVTVGLLRRKRR